MDHLANAAQSDPTVRPYRSFLDLSERKIFCIMAAPSKEALAAWFQKMQMPCDYIALSDGSESGESSKKHDRRTGGGSGGLSQGCSVDPLGWPPL